MRRGVVGALASGDARVRRACGAVRKGARAEAGWRRAPRARAIGFMGVWLRTLTRPTPAQERELAHWICGMLWGRHVTPRTAQSPAHKPRLFDHPVCPRDGCLLRGRCALVR